MKIIIGADHGGYELKAHLVNWLTNNNYDFVDAGTYSEDSCDYPDVASQVSKRVSNKEFDRGILLCGSGIGVTIVANKFKNIRAALCCNPDIARLSREHNNANILTLGGRFIDKTTGEQILQIWLTTKFQGARHQRRLDKLNMLEKENLL